MAVYPPHPPFKISSGSYDMQIPSTNLYSRMEKGTAKVTECPVQEMLQRDPRGLYSRPFLIQCKGRWTTNSPVESFILRYRL